MRNNYNEIIDGYVQRLIKVLDRYRISSDQNAKKLSDLLQPINNKGYYIINRGYFDSAYPTNVTEQDLIRGQTVSDNTIITDNEETISFDLRKLLYYLQNLNTLTLEEFYYCFEIMIEVLDCLYDSVKNTNSGENDIVPLLHDLVNVLKFKLKYSEIPTTVLSNDNNSKPDYKGIDYNLNYLSFRRALSKITEEKRNDEKVKSYINVIYPRLLLSYITNRLMDKKVSFRKWFSDVLYFPLFGATKDNKDKEDRIETRNYVGYLKKRDCKIGSENEKKAKQFLLGSDLDFWLKIVNANNYSNNGNRAKYGYLFFNGDKISIDYISAMNDELKQIRNCFSHAGDTEFSSRVVIKVLAQLADFAGKAGLLRESILLNRRLYYERLYCYCNDKPKSYTEVDYSNYPVEIKGCVPCWKCVVARKEAPENLVFDDVLDRDKGYKLIINSILAFDNQKSEIIKIIKNHFLNHSIMFPLSAMDAQFINCYPFHPAFFELTQKMSLSEVYDLAQYAVNKAYENESYDNKLIMPWEIDINYEPLHNLLEEEFTFGYRRNPYDWSLTPNPHGWNFLKNNYVIQNSYEFVAECEKQHVDPTFCNNLTKIILLLSTKELYLDLDNNGRITLFKQWKSGVMPNRDYLRYCMYSPGSDISEVEKAISTILFVNPFIRKETKEIHETLEYAGEQKKEYIYYEVFFEFLLPYLLKENIDCVGEIIRSDHKKIAESREKLIFELSEIEKEKCNERVKRIEEIDSSIPEEEKVMGYRRNFAQYAIEDEKLACEENIKRIEDESVFFSNYISYVLLRYKQEMASSESIEKSISDYKEDLKKDL